MIVRPSRSVLPGSGLGIRSLTRDELVVAAEVLDNTVECLCGCEIHKAGEGKRLPFEQAMAELLLTGWANASRGAVEVVLKRLAAQEGELTGAQTGEILALIRDQVDKKFVRRAASGLPALFLDSYGGAKGGVLRRHRQKLTMTDFDDVAVDWLNQHHMFWIGGYYDKNLSGKIAERIALGIQQGIGRERLGSDLKTFFDDYPAVPVKPESYWRGMAANGMNRSQSFGEIAGYEEVGVRYLQIVAVMDERTTLLCQQLNGRLIPVQVAANQRDRMMTAADPEEVKSIAPWLKPQQVQGKTDRQVTDMGIGAPPYHWHCRTILVEVQSS